MEQISAQYRMTPNSKVDNKRRWKSGAVRFRKVISQAGIAERLRTFGSKV